MTASETCGVFSPGGNPCRREGVHATHLAGYGSASEEWPNEEVDLDALLVPPSKREIPVSELLEDVEKVRAHDRARRVAPVDANVAPVGHAHPQTAKDAARRALPRTGTMGRLVFDLIAARYPDGLTCDEVERMQGWAHQSASPIFTRLKQSGWIEWGGHKRPVQRSGNDAEVMVLTDIGRIEAGV